MATVSLNVIAFVTVPDELVDFEDEGQTPQQEKAFDDAVDKAIDDKTNFTVVEFDIGDVFAEEDEDDEEE